MSIKIHLVCNKVILASVASGYCFSLAKQDVVICPCNLGNVSEMVSNGGAAADILLTVALKNMCVHWFQSSSFYLCFLFVLTETVGLYCVIFLFCFLSCTRDLYNGRKKAKGRKSNEAIYPS